MYIAICTAATTQFAPQLTPFSIVGPQQQLAGKKLKQYIAHERALWRSLAMLNGFAIFAASTARVCVCCVCVCEVI